jgi:hypothetical protein
MTTAVLKLSRMQKDLQNRIDSVELPVVNWKTICLAGFFISFALLIFYVWQVVGLTKGVYLTNDYQKQIGRLSEENQNLQISFAESSFLGEALTKIEVLNFQKTTSVKYIQLSEGNVQTVAANK